MPIDFLKLQEWSFLPQDFLVLYQIFFTMQLKRGLIISNDYGIDELPNDLRS